jgi:hypothetical protein
MGIINLVTTHGDSDASWLCFLWSVGDYNSWVGCFASGGYVCDGDEFNLYLVLPGYPGTGAPVLAAPIIRMHWLPIRDRRWTLVVGGTRTPSRCQC